MPLVTSHHYINNCLGSFFRGVLQWMSTEFYPDFKYKIIGSYDKSVEYFNKRRELDREVVKQILPAVTLDPSYDFQLEERAGKFLWQIPTLAPGLGCKLFNPLDGLRNQDVTITPVFSRYQGTFDLIFWLHSVYELLDFRVKLFQFSGGYNRIMRPDMFDSFIIMPQDILDYKIDGERVIDWSDTTGETIIITNMGIEKFVYPVKLTPWFKFTSITDASRKYGGDSIAEYKLQATVEWEIELPTYLVLETYVQSHVGQYIRINFDAKMDFAYSKYGQQYIETLNPDYFVPGEKISGNCSSGFNYKHNTQKAIYAFTEEDIETKKSEFILDNPFDSTSSDDIMIVSYDGIVPFGDQWSYDINTNKLTVNIEARETEIIEMLLYEH